MAEPTDLQRLARRALLIRAKADAALVALVPVASIAPDGERPWPILLIETPTTRRLNASCVRGAEVSFDVHAFARARKSGGREVETGYDHASRIGGQIERTFADNWLDLENGARCRVRFSDTQLLRDGKPDDWHWFGQLNCRVLAV
jgi:hypothetical protein